MATVLSTSNSHPRDARLTANMDTHVYYIDGQPARMSITKLKGMFMPEFDADGIIEGMWGLKAQFGRPPKRTMASVDENTPYPGTNPDYLGKTRGEILDAWDMTSVVGTTIHEAIEHYLDFYSQHLNHSHGRSERLHRLLTSSSRQDILRANTSTLDAFLDFEEIWGRRGWVIHRVEWRIFDDRPFRNVAGTIDAVYKRENPETKETEYCIVDWKVTPKNLKDVKGDAKCLPPIEHLANNKYNGYFLQVQIYGEILQERYGVNIVDYVLVQLIPEGHEPPPTPNKPLFERHPGFIIHDNCPDLSDAVEALVRIDTMHCRLDETIRIWEAKGGGMYPYLPKTARPLLFEVHNEYEGIKEGIKKRRCDGGVEGEGAGVKQEEEKGGKGKEGGATRKGEQTTSPPPPPPAAAEPHVPPA